MALEERHVLEELRNVGNAGHRGMFPGDSISHMTLNEVVRRGWAERTPEGDVRITSAGQRLLADQAPAIPDEWWRTRG